MTETPEDRRIIVFKRGTWSGLNTLIPKGGHIRPISLIGDKLEWKKAQKKEKKKKISEIINKIIPHRIPLITFIEWSPWRVLSREISRHHWNVVKNNVIKPKSSKVKLNEWNHEISPEVSIVAPIEAIKGQGLWSTIWK